MLTEGSVSTKVLENYEEKKEEAEVKEEVWEVLKGFNDDEKKKSFLKYMKIN